LVLSEWPEVFTEECTLHPCFLREVHIEEAAVHTLKLQFWTTRDSWGHDIFTISAEVDSEHFDDSLNVALGIHVANDKSVN